MRRSSWRLACLFCLPLPLIACRESAEICQPTPTQPCPGEAASLVGAVLDNGHPLFGVTVSLSGPGDDQTAVTDGAGAFSFTRLRDGDYTVTVSGQPGPCQDDGGFSRQAMVPEDGVATVDVRLDCSQTWVALSAGRGTCGIRSTGRAYCWGRGGSGALGSGFNADVANPSAVASTASFVQVEHYFDSSCGLTGNGAFCWGENENGALGNGTTDDSNVPVQVQTGAILTELGDGGCALDSSGLGYCWGFNDRGQVGDGTTETRLVPTQVSGGLTFTSIGAGERHGCGASGGAYCWGDNQRAQLGTGQTGASEPSPV
ncbi:MAG: hypothetical protein HKN73_19575, partial [Gemmatimonadetes bacterium]|nr:hypothetical protein [Gemmatimonadota bacterium]